MCAFMYLDQPSILYQPTNFTVVQNNSVNIPCGIVVTGAEVEYFWLLNNNQLNLSSSRYTMREGNITVTNVQAEDNGTYECLANLSVTDNMADDLQLPIGSGIISVICKFSIYPHLYIMSPNILEMKILCKQLPHPFLCPFLAYCITTLLNCFVYI